MEPLQADNATGKSVGIGLRVADMPEFLTKQPSVGWVEVHPENYMYGRARLQALAAMRCDYELSLHGVGLSLGSAEGLQADYLLHLASLTAELDPGLVSDHLSWSLTGGKYLNVLLPLPYTEESLGVVCRNVDAAQHALGRRILLENVAAYIRFRHSEIAEPEFLTEVARRTGCGVLCDLNNVFVTCTNFGIDPVAYISAMSPAAVSQIHLGGHTRIRCHDRWLLFDDHGASVDRAVWHLYREAMRRFGAKPTLIEWDTAPPPLDVLLAEAWRAEEIMSGLATPSAAEQ